MYCSRTGSPVPALSSTDDLGVAPRGTRVQPLCRESGRESSGTGLAYRSELFLLIGSHLHWTSVHIYFYFVAGCAVHVKKSRTLAHDKISNMIGPIANTANSRQKLDQADAKPNQSRLGHVRFPALGTGCVCFFNFAAIGNSDSFVSN